jgi:N-acetylglucosamine-6-sulfatase
MHINNVVAATTMVAKRTDGGNELYRALIRRIVVGLLLSPCLFAQAQAAQQAMRPNMVVVVVDDLRWDELGCTGHPFVRTPHIDRIACEGVRFRNAFASTPLCSPSRATLLTGQYASRHGVIDNTNRSELSHRLPTFPRRLQAAGYETAFVGKWHMGNDDTPRPGFDHWAALAGQGTSSDPTLNINGQRRRIEGYTTDVLTDEAVRFVGRRRDKPFCLYLAHKALHPETMQRDDGSITDAAASRFIPAPRHEGLYADAPVPRRLNVTDTLAGKPALTRKLEGVPPLGRATGTSDEVVRDRLRMLTAVDEGLGRLMEALEGAGALDRTAIVFLSDHGYFYGEHGLSVERRLAYEEAIRIPLLVRFPSRFPRGRLIDEFALTADLAPTLLELAGAAPSDESKLDGRSLLPLLEGQHVPDWRTSFVIEYFTDTVFPRVRSMGYRAVRTQRHKLIHYRELDAMDELYDLVNDPYELRNLIADPASKQIVESLRRKL